MPPFVVMQGAKPLPRFCQGVGGEMGLVLERSWPSQLGDVGDGLVGGYVGEEAVERGSCGVGGLGEGGSAWPGLWGAYISGSL